MIAAEIVVVLSYVNHKGTRRSYLLCNANSDAFLCLVEGIKNRNIVVINSSDNNNNNSDKQLILLSVTGAQIFLKSFIN